ncbi:MAG: isoleucine--tRNA ligase, partial [Proteobacteria bacterium]|nr:isoleucine--tRNA ligase [Pseudomonadota bacterium]
MSEIKINLPSTSFPMKANLPAKEPEIIKFWEEINLYQELRSKSKGRDKFILHDGPPYANGHIHIGTALNKILKDIVVRFNQMMGKDAPYVPGWDCHGLPIEWKVEEEYKKKGKNKDTIPVNEFREECRQFAASWIEIQKKEFNRLGVNGDWKNHYTTMSKSSEAQIAREISKFIINGGLYRGFKPVLWSVVETTALADAEVEYYDHTSNTIYTKFLIKSGPEKFMNSSVVIWTTTPWTIPCNRALAFNNKINYSIIKINNNEKIIIAEKLVDKVLVDCKITNFEIVESFSGSELKNIICNHPFKEIGYTFDVPMLDGNFVNLEQGTGIVHCAPSHGPDDYYLCLNNNIQAFDTIDDKGHYTKNIIKFAGTHIFKADDIIINELMNSNSLLGKGKLKHSYPHSWRSKAPLVHRATPQWFISMETNKLRQKSLTAIGNTKFYPAVGQNRLRSMIETRPDWCVSRQRVWGVPLPIFISKKTGKPLADEKVLEGIAKIFEEEGSDSWFIRKPQDFLGKDYNAKDYEQVRDIVEVWFDSGSTHSYVLDKRPELTWPANLYLEGSDQHRGWFHSSLLESCGTKGTAPFQNILCHGFVVDGKGQKMSKSLGNVVMPEEVIKNFGADILRLWVVASDYSEDLKIDKAILNQHAESYRRIRNTLRFLLGNLNDKLLNDDFTKIDYSNLSSLEKYILLQVYELDLRFRDYINSYNFHKIYVELLNFCTLDLSAFYFDIKKDILYCDSENSLRRNKCLEVLNVLTNFLLKWFSPILAFTSEEAYQVIKNKNYKSIHLQDFPIIPSTWNNSEVKNKWIGIKKVKQVVNAAIEDIRSTKIIGSSLEANVIVYLKEEYLNLIKEEDLSEIFICSEAKAEPLINQSNLFSLKDIEGVAVKIVKAKGQKCPRC